MGRFRLWAQTGVSVELEAESLDEARQLAAEELRYANLVLSDENLPLQMESKPPTGFSLASWRPAPGESPVMLLGSIRGKPSQGHGV